MDMYAEGIVAAVSNMGTRESLCFDFFPSYSNTYVMILPECCHLLFTRILQRPPNSRKISGGEQCEHYGGFTGALSEASIRQRWGKNGVHESSKLKPLLTKKIEAVKTNRFGGKTSLQKSCRVISTAQW